MQSKQNAKSPWRVHTDGSLNTSNKKDAGNAWPVVDHTSIDKFSYLHTHVVKDQARCVIKEPVPLPVEDHIALFMIVCHCVENQIRVTHSNIVESQQGQWDHITGKHFQFCLMIMAKEITAAALFVSCPEVFSSPNTWNPLKWITAFVFLQHTFDFIEGFRDKGLDGFEALNYEPQSWELATAIADQLVCQNVREDLLEPQGLESGESSTWGNKMDARIEYFSNER